MIVFVLLSVISILGYAALQNITITWVISNNTPSIILDDPTDEQILNVNITQFNWTSNDLDSDVLDHVWYVDITDTFTSPFLRVVDVDINETYTNTVAFDDGNWYWRVEVTDGDDINVSETWNFTIKTNVSNSFPYLSDWNLAPSNGDTYDNFVYTVNFTDADNNTASFVNLTINGSYHYSMTEVDAGDINTSDGKQYIYSTTLPVGTHNYTFTCSDGVAVNSTDVYSGPTVVVSGNVPPVQSDPIPTNGSSYLSLPLSVINISVNDANGDSIDIYVFTNWSGIFELVNSSIGVGNGSLSFTNTSWVSDYHMVYYWFVNITDGVFWDNQSYYFGTDTLRIYDVFPSNNSYLQSLQPTVFFSLSNPSGLMNYTIYVGNSSVNATIFLSNDSGVGNGTYHYNNYYTASNYTSYWWRVSVNDGVQNINETFVFTCVRAGGGVISSGGGSIGIAAGGMLIGTLALVVAYSKRRKKGNNGNGGYS